MSKRNVRQSINDMVDFMKTKVTSNLMESDLDLDHRSAETMAGIVDMSISQAFSLAYGSVDSALDEFENNLKTTKKSTKRSAKK